MQITTEELHSSSQENLLQGVCNWSEHSGTMLPLNQESIRNHPLGMVALSPDGNITGYAAITTIYDGLVAEFGGLVVDPALRKQGIATALTQRVLQHASICMPDIEQIIAFANSKSLPLFQNLGGITIGERETLPSGCWELCEACPKKPTNPGQQTCCDTVVDLTNIGGLYD